MSKFSDFLRNATEAERAEVFHKVMDEACADQTRQMQYADLVCDECGTTDPDDFIQDSLFESLCIACIQEAEMTELNDDYPRDLDPTEELNFEDGIYNHCSPLVDVRDWE